MKMRVNFRLIAPSILFALALASTANGQYVLDSVDTGGWNQGGFALNWRANVLYGTCFYGRNFFAIDCAADTLVAQIPLVYPGATAYNSTMNRAYCLYSYHDEDSVLVVDGSTHTRIKAVRVDGAYGPVWDSVSNRLYITCFDYDEVAVYDCASDSVICRIAIPGEPVWLTVNTRRRKLYVQNDYDMTVSVIDMNTNRVIRNVYVGSWFFCAAYSAVADKYFCNGEQGVAVICGAGDTLIAHIGLPQGYGVTSMASVEPESLVMVAAYSGGADSVFVIDARTNNVLRALRVAADPRVLMFSESSGAIYCASAGWNCLTVIAPDGSRVLVQVSVSDGPISLAGCPERMKLYVGHGGRTNMIYVLQDTVGGIAEPRTGSPPVAARLSASPSPFRDRVSFDVFGDAPVFASIGVYAMDGRLVRQLDSGRQRGGVARWDGRDAAGRELISGDTILLIGNLRHIQRRSATKRAAASNGVL